MTINEALRLSRAASGKSQEFLALELGIARKTVQNWEKGISEPTIKQAIEWFRILGISPLPYLFQTVYPDMEGIKSSDDLKTLKLALENLVDSLPEEGVRQLLYLFYGDHGSSPRAVLNMVTAHLQTPMKDRVTNGTVVLKNYEMAERKDRITSKDHIKPDKELLKHAIALGEDAAVNDSMAYVFDKNY